MASASTHPEHHSAFSPGEILSETAQQAYELQTLGQSSATLIPPSATTHYFQKYSSSSAAISDSAELELGTSSDVEMQMDHGGSQNFSNPNSQSHVRRWTPLPVKKWVVCIFIGWCFLLIVALVVLLVLSALWNGLFALNLQRTDVLPFWHFVSTAIATGTAYALRIICGSVVLCEVYIYLRQEDGVSVGESLTLDTNLCLLGVIFRSVRLRRWAVLFCAVAMMLSVTFSSLTASLFSSMDVWVEQPLQFHSNKALGPNNIINATDNLIEGLNLASVYTFKADAVSLPAFINQAWAIAPIDPIVDPAHLRLHGSDPSSAANYTIQGWYGILSEPNCHPGRLVTVDVTDSDVTPTFVDQNGECIFKRYPISRENPFFFFHNATICDHTNASTAHTLAENAAVVFGRISPSLLTGNNMSSAFIAYCRPRVAVLSVDPTLDSRTHDLLSIENVRPLSSEQQRLYDPTNFTNFLLTHALNGFAVDPNISASVPAPMIAQLNESIDYLNAMAVGHQWSMQSTIFRDGNLTDNPQAYSDSFKQFYMNTLNNFYQPYLTLLAAGSYFKDAPQNVSGSGNLHGYQTRLVVSFPFCLTLIILLSVSTLLLFLGIIIPPAISLPIGTPATMLITAIKLGMMLARRPEMVELGDLRGYDADALGGLLAHLRFTLLDEGELMPNVQAEVQGEVQGDAELRGRVELQGEVD